MKEFDHHQTAITQDMTQPYEEISVKLPDASTIVQSLSEAEMVTDMVNEFGEILHSPELTNPLHLFLTRIGKESPTGLQGVALAAWDVQSEPSYLAVYALIDETAQLNADSQETNSLLRAHDKLNEELRAEKSNLTCGLWFIQTRGEDLESLAPKLPELLTSPDPLEVYPREDERIAHLRIVSSNPINS